MFTVKFNDTQIGSSYQMTLLVSGIEERKTRSGDPYCQISFSDGAMNAKANIFNNTTKQTLADKGIVPDSAVNVGIRCSEYNGSKNYTLDSIEHADLTYDELKTLIVTPPESVKTLFVNILNKVKDSSGRPYDKSVAGVPDDDFSLTALTNRLLWENRTEFMKSSAAKSMHHNLFGGLVYHTSRMVSCAFEIANVYTHLNRELLVCATALHDIGKLTELSTSGTGNAEYTVDGRLFGHAYIGMCMIDAEVAKHPDEYDAEEIRLLKHMLASHHGTLEWGAITEPAIPEAMALHFVDMIDSRMYMYEHGLESTEENKLSDRIFGIAGDKSASIYNSPKSYNS